MISPLIKWDHSDDWYVSRQKASSGERIVEISLSDPENESLSGHIVDGRNLFPGTGYLCMVWESFGLMRGKVYTDVSVVFEDVRFLRATNIPKTGTLEFTVTIHKGYLFYENEYIVSNYNYLIYNVCFRNWQI